MKEQNKGFQYRLPTEEELLNSLEFDRKVYLLTEKAEKEEYYQAGYQEGILEGLREYTCELIEDQYPHQDLSWINECNKNQLEKIIQILYLTDEISYQEFLLQCFRYY